MTPAERQAAGRWLAVDPDDDTRVELAALLADDSAELARRFGTRLSFGTAGIRGRLGAGPSRMNRVLVRIVASALGERVRREREADPCVVVGRDARRLSDAMADDTARVLAARGIRVVMLADPAPTPLLAFAVRHLGASAGVMITASHNPRDDNGVKLYWRGGAQLSSPIDGEIAAIIERTEPLAEAELESLRDPAITIAGDDLTQSYLDAITSLVTPGGARSIRIAYTPLHGVGAATFLKACEAAGFTDVAVVAQQARPSADFPTTPFPNPEEPGALDLLLRLAAETEADLAIAHDPDADRVAVGFRAPQGWRVLTGDEAGCLLAEHLLRRGLGPESPTSDTDKRRLLINTVVSSSLLGKICADHGADYAQTLTGFKWIMKARSERCDTHDMVLGYEDALGYAVGEAVQDKDGLSSGLLLAELAARLAVEGRSLGDLLDDLHSRHGVHVSAQRSIRFDSADAPLAVMAERMTALRARPPTRLAGCEVTASRDLAEGHGDLPPTDALILAVGHDCKVMIRPSGTEPKIKVYGEVSGAAGDAGAASLAVLRTEAQERLETLLQDAVRLVEPLLAR